MSINCSPIVISYNISYNISFWNPAAETKRKTPEFLKIRLIWFINNWLICIKNYDSGRTPLVLAGGDYNFVTKLLDAGGDPAIATYDDGFLANEINVTKTQCLGKLYS